MPEDARRAPGRSDRWIDALSALGLVVLNAFLVLPSPSRLASHVTPNAGDPVFVTWAMEHQARALLADPGAIYAANIFYPEPAAIAWSENLTAFVPPYLLVWLVSGRDSVVAYNAVTWLAFAGGSLAVLVLARRLLRSPLAATVVAVAFSLAMVRRSAVGHTQLAGFLFLPLAFSLLMDVVERRRLRSAVLAGACLAGLWYSAIYFFVLAVVVVPAFALAWGARHRHAVDRRLVALAGAVALTAALAVAPSLPPYLDVQRRASFERSDADLVTIGTHSFTQPDSLVYRALDEVDRTIEGSDGFLGWTVMGLAGLAVGGLAVDRLRRRRGAGEATEPDLVGPDLVGDASGWSPAERRRQLGLPLAVAAAGAALLSLGPDDGPASVPYELLRGVVPGLGSTRVLSRFWALPALGVALLAGRGFERLTGLASRRFVAVAAAAVVGLLVAELFVRPHTAEVADGPALVAVNQALAQLPQGVVTELPVPTPPHYAYALAARQLRSLVDGMHRVEGYSGDTPAGLGEYFQAVSAFPADHAIEAMRQAGVRHVVLHGAGEPCASRYGPAELDEILARAVASPAVEAVTRVGAEAIVTLTPEPRRGPLREIPPAAPLPRRATGCGRD